ncbi:MAG: hypothetical protein ACRD4C_08680 [Candidatus Acidiferrales bacterium]
MRKFILMFHIWLLGSVAAFAQVSITTEAYDNNRTASNLNETVLNTSNVNVDQFGKLFSQPVDGSVYAQPLYVPNVTIHGAAHNVVYVATMNDSVYAFDADSNSGTNVSPLWKVSFTNPPSVTAPVSQDGNIDGVFGIESTPVIDTTTGTIYAVALTEESSQFVYRLHALDITNGTEKFGGPVVISGSVSGAGPGSSGGTLAFDPNQHQQRPALALANGTIFVAFGSFGDEGTWHGWIMGYNAGNLSKTATTCITPNGSDGAIWMSGRGPVIDSSNNVYYVTANGDYDGVGNFGDAFVKFSTTNGQLALTDWFAPDDFLFLAENDDDLGASGPLMIPGTNVILGGGKTGLLFVLNASSLGHESTGNPHVIQEIDLGSGAGIFNGPAFYNRTAGAGPWLYIWPNGGFLTAYRFNGSSFDATPVSQSTFTSQSVSYSASLAVSANGNTPGTGIVWAAMPATPNNFDGGTSPGILYAFDASNLGTVLWNSNTMANRDSAGIWSKFRSPVVANGKVYLGSFQNFSSGAPGALNVYGLLPIASGSPTATAAFIAKDSTTSGSWQGTYGGDGHILAGSSQALPSYGAFSVNGGSTWTWASSTTDPRGLQVPTGGRIAVAWYNTTTPFNVTANFTDGQTHKLSLYLVDWDNHGRSEIVQVLDAGTGIPLDTENVTNFSGGVYLSWNISGNVIVTFAGTSGPNSVLSGVFFGGGSQSGSGGSGGSGGTSSAAFVRMDTTTQGAWTGSYGATGYDIVGAPLAVPSNIAFAIQNALTWTWPGNTTDPRALRLPGNSRGTAEAWYGSSFQFSLTFNDGNSHRFALYAVDWDTQGRSETIQITDNTGHPLDTRTITSFTNGVYLLWNITGSVVINVVANTGPNAVVSGVFFDSASTGAPVNGQWSWPALAGASSYNVYRSTASGGPWTLLRSISTPSFTDSTVVSGQTYYYRVTSVSGGVEQNYVMASIIVP